MPDEVHNSEQDTNLSVLLALQHQVIVMLDAVGAGEMYSG